MLYYSKKECAVRYINPGFLHSPSNKAFDETARSKHTISLHSFGKLLLFHRCDPYSHQINPSSEQNSSTGPNIQTSSDRRSRSVSQSSATHGRHTLPSHPTLPRDTEEPKFRQCRTSAVSMVSFLSKECKILAPHFATINHEANQIRAFYSSVPPRRGDEKQKRRIYSQSPSTDQYSVTLHRSRHHNLFCHSPSI